MSRNMWISVCFSVGCAFATVGAAGESIAYRLPKWKTLHFDDSVKARQHLATVRKLGGEGNEDKHGGHIDVSYRSSDWRSIEVSSERLVHQWEAWLKGAGFETLHGHAHSHTGQNQANHDHADHNHGPHMEETLAYRMANWKKVHLKAGTRAEEFLALMKGFGCEVKTKVHSGHVEASVRCREWKEIGLPSHGAALSWQSWLVKYGFEVEHAH